MRLLDALQCQNRGRVPVWLMRQAGRYLPEYRKMKEGRRLWEMFHDPQTIVEVTLLPIELLGVDGAIVFSDILTILDGLGVKYDFEEGGPVVYGSKVNKVDGAYEHLTGAMRELRKRLKVPLLGFAGAPFTIASYMVEGKTSRDHKKTKQWMMSEPKSFFELLEKITEETITYLNCQIDAGAQAVQLFDSWANALALDEFREACLKPMRRIVEAVKRRGVPIILFARGSCFFVDELVSIEPSAISLDWSGDLVEIRKKIPAHIAVQGNLDPMALYATQEVVQRKVEALLSGMEGDPGYIFNLGHGLLPDTPFENVKFMVDYVHSRSPALTQAQ